MISFRTLADALTRFTSSSRSSAQAKVHRRQQTTLQSAIRKTEFFVNISLSPLCNSRMRCLEYEWSNNQASTVTPTGNSTYLSLKVGRAATNDHRVEAVARVVDVPYEYRKTRRLRGRIDTPEKSRAGSLIQKAGEPSLGLKAGLTKLFALFQPMQGDHKELFCIRLQEVTRMHQPPLPRAAFLPSHAW